MSVSFIVCIGGRYVFVIFCGIWVIYVKSSNLNICEWCYEGSVGIVNICGCGVNMLSVCVWSIIGKIVIEE